MQKIPTMFERDWDGDRSRVVDQVHPSCGWVVAGEGAATRKLDGTCCLVRAGALFKRRELRPGDTTPWGFELAGEDDETGKRVGWVPVDHTPSDQYHREAFERQMPMADGTYELVGPKVQGNREGYAEHTLVAHSDPSLVINEAVPRDFAGLRGWLVGKPIEGLVFHHTDGRMAKIKLRDFGMKR